MISGATLNGAAMNTKPETPQVFQSKEREGFIRGRRSSVASAVERFESETLDDLANLHLSERAFTIRFEAYDEIQVGPKTSIRLQHMSSMPFPHFRYIRQFCIWIITPIKK